MNLLGRLGWQCASIHPSWDIHVSLFQLNMLLRHIYLLCRHESRITNEKIIIIHGIRRKYILVELLNVTRYYKYVTDVWPRLDYDVGFKIAYRDISKRFPVWVHLLWYSSPTSRLGPTIPINWSSNKYHLVGKIGYGELIDLLLASISIGDIFVFLRKLTLSDQ